MQRSAGSVSRSLREVAKVCLRVAEAPLRQERTTQAEVLVRLEAKLAKRVGMLEVLSAKIKAQAISEEKKLYVEKAHEY